MRKSIWVIFSWEILWNRVVNFCEKKWLYIKIQWKSVQKMHTKNFEYLISLGKSTFIYLFQVFFFYFYTLNRIREPVVS